MKKSISIVAVATLVLLFIMTLEVNAKEMTGKEIAFDRKLGNCLACHSVSDGGQPGNIGPPLMAMKVRFPDKVVLRAQIWDATARNPKTLMPPFGKHKMLTENQIDKVVDFIYSL